MKPTTDIVEELRLYNRWRRGDEAITAPDPTALGKLLDDAADRIEHLFASEIHTCHADCQRPMCVLRRERDKAHADLARVTAERDNARGNNKLLDNECHALRARVAELEKEAMILRGTVEAVTTQRQQAEQRNAELEATIAELTTDGNAATLAANLAKASKRNAELVEQLKAYGKYAHDTTLEDQNAELMTALRPLAMVAKYCGQINDSTGVWSHTSIIDGEHFSLTIGDCRRASATLARAESATPDKHPDTEIVDWLEDNTAVPYCAGLYDSSPDAAVEIPGIGVFVGETLRAAIDAARKALAESGAPLPMREDPRYRGTDFRSALDVDRASQGGGK